jgi:hypothetical protein
MKLIQVARFAVPFALACSLLPAAAAPASTAPSCNTSNVQLTGITVSGTNTSLYNAAVNGGPLSAAYCVGASGNDSGTLDPRGNNIGELGDGLLNGAGNKWTDAQWLDRFPKLDLDGDGVATDPGWIYLGKADGMGSAGTYVMDGHSRPIDIDSVLKMTFQCAGKCNSGTWSLTTSPDLGDWIEDILGRSTFDHLALVLKAGNNFVVYDFDFHALAAGIPEFDFQTPYSFTGTWATGDLGNKSISHISTWARDPVLTDTPENPSEVPEPASVVLFGLALAGLSLVRRRAR